MKISFVIPNYNGEALLENNLPHVLDVLQKEIVRNKCVAEVIVIDDGSTDKSLEILQKLPAQRGDLVLKILKNQINLGFSPTVNKGVKEATGEIVVLLNTDVTPKENFLDPLLMHFVDENVFAGGAMDESIEHGKPVYRGRGVGGWERGFLFHKRGEVDKLDTLWVSGGSGAFRKSLWDKLGGLCELYAPFYWEDIDLSYRAQKSGYTVLFEKGSVVEHRHEEGAIKKSVEPNKIKSVSYRNQFFFVWLNITDPFLLLSHIAWLPHHLASAIKSGNTAFLTGFGNAVLELGKVFAYRKQNRRFFELTDRDVLRKNT